MKSPNLLSSRKFWRLIMLVIVVIASIFLLLRIYHQTTFRAVWVNHSGWIIALIAIILLVILATKRTKLGFVSQVLGFLFFCIFVGVIYPSSKNKKRGNKNRQVSTTLSTDSISQTPQTVKPSLDISNDPRIIHLRDSLANTKAEADSLVALANAAADSLEREKMFKSEATKILGSICGPSDQIKAAKIALKKIAEERAALSVVNPCDFKELNSSNSFSSSNKSNLKKKRGNKKRSNGVSTPTRHISNFGGSHYRPKQQVRYVPPPDRLRSRCCG